MSSEAPTPDRPPGEASLVHQAGVYGSDEELVDLVVPFLREGVEAGDPTLVALGVDQPPTVQATLDELSGLQVLDPAHHERPLATLQVNHRLITDHADAGARRIRLINQPPSALLGACWDLWARYEAVITRRYAALPLLVLCCYDARAAPADVLDEVRRVHPYLVEDRTAHPNPRHTDPAELLFERARLEIDPVEGHPPDLERVDPTAAEARHAVAALAQTAALDEDAADGLRLAVTETLTNAALHGRPPVTLRAWAPADRVVVTVHDHGRGPGDPYVGLAPPDRDVDSGHGLWVAHHVCRRVTLTSGPDGFTAHLLAGTPYAPIDRH